MNVYKCLICGEIYTSLRDIEWHVETEHWIEAEEQGVSNCYEIIPKEELEAQLETLKTIEKKLMTLAKEKKEEYPKPYKYQGKYYYPYYGQVYRSQDKSLFLCLEHQFVTSSASEMLKHLLKEHGQKEGKEFGKQVCAEIVLDRIRNKFGSTERISPEDLRRYAEEELKEIFMLKELTTPTKSKALLGYASEKIGRLKEFLTNERVEICPVCNRDSWSTFSDPAYQYKAREVLTEIAKNTKTWKRCQKDREEALSDYKKPIPRLQDYAKNLVYSATIDSKRVKVPIHKVIHLSLEHPKVLERLLAERVIDSKDIMKLHSAIHERKSEEKLRQHFRVTNVENRLSPEERLRYRWLKGEGN